MWTCIRGDHPGVPRNASALCGIVRSSHSESKQNERARASNSDNADLCTYLKLDWNLKHGSHTGSCSRCLCRDPLSSNTLEGHERDASKTTKSSTRSFTQDDNLQGKHVSIVPTRARQTGIILSIALMRVEYSRPEKLDFARFPAHDFPRSTLSVNCAPLSEMENKS